MGSSPRSATDPPGSGLAALDQLLESTVLLGDDMRRFVESSGLTENRVHLLWVLAQGGPRPQRDLAAALDVSARTVTALVDALEASGHVSREPHPQDRRAVLVTPTAHGQALLTDLQAGRAQLAAQLFEDADPDDLARFGSVLAGVNARLRALTGA